MICCAVRGFLYFDRVVKASFIAANKSLGAYRSLGAYKFVAIVVTQYKKRLKHKTKISYAVEKQKETRSNPLKI
jgi:hypothetical protein